MAYLDIAFLTGDSERRPLSKQQPVSIGSHKSNDICLDEGNVELIHCRISWNKTGYEAVAAGVEPLDVNGTLLQRSKLQSGDVLRIGSVDITFHGTDDEGAAADAAAGGGEETFGLKPLTSELPTFLEPEVPRQPAAPRKASRGAKPAAEKGHPAVSAVERRASPARPASEPHHPPAEGKSGATAAQPPQDWMHSLAALAAESQVDLPAQRTAARPADARPTAEDTEEDDDDLEPAEASRPAKPASPLSDRLRTALHHRRERPGEEDALRSPLVLGLGAIAAGLLLMAAVFYFIADRRSTQEEFGAARALFDEGKYAQAITQLELFANAHLGHALEQPARMLAGLARVDRHLSGAVKDWPQALDALKAFIKESRDYDAFEAQHPAIWDRARRIARGAAETAGKQFSRPLLQISDDAVLLVNTYAPKDAPPTEILQEIARLRRQSEAAILRNETFESALATLAEAIQANDPIRALEVRRDLLTRYPEFAQDRRLTAQMQATLDTEARLVTSQQLDRTALTDERPSGTPLPLSLVFHARSRTDVVSVGETAYVLAKDCIYGIDTVTGDPVWRRVIGPNPPFFPMREPGVPSLVLFDTRHAELIRIHQNTGELIWRLPLDEAVAGQPLLDEGQLYVPTEGGALYKVDLQTGSASTRLTFSQPITGPVALRNGSHLVVAGDRDVVYTLSKQPLACVSVSYIAHKPRSIDAPLLSIGPYVLLGENQGTRQCTLRLLSTSDPLRLSQVAAATIPGRVLDTPVIRGRDLFVPTSRERIAAFTVSDDPGQPPLLTGPAYEVQGGGESPTFLATGPDRQLWMASSALRKLQLTSSALEAEQKVVAVGLASQPLQYVGDTMFNARQRPYTSAVTFTQTNRDELTSDWQAVVGAQILAHNASSSGLVCVTEAGHVFRTTPALWGRGGFYGDAVRLPLSDELREPIRGVSFGDGQLAVAAGGDEPKLWLISRLGQVDATVSLPAALEAAPAPMGTRFLLPTAGRLQLSTLPGQPPVQEVVLPSDQTGNTRWRQVIGLDEQNAIAITGSGQVLQIRQQSNPRLHLAEITRLDLGAAVGTGADARDGRIAIADAAHRVRLLDALTLDASGQRTLEAPVTNDVWLTGDALFVETGFDQCHCLELNEGLSSRWEQPVALSAGLAGRPLVAGGYVLLADVSGIVRLVELATGQVRAELDAGCALSGAPLEVAGEWLVPTLDGSLVRVNSLKPE